MAIPPAIVTPAGPGIFLVLLMAGVLSDDSSTFTFERIPQGFSSYVLLLVTSSNGSDDLLLTVSPYETNWTQIINGEKTEGANDTAIHLAPGLGGLSMALNVSLTPVPFSLLVRGVGSGGDAFGTSGNQFNLIDSGGIVEGVQGGMPDFALMWADSGVFLANSPPCFANLYGVP